MKLRLLNFDVAKSLCIMLVAIGHNVDNAWYIRTNISITAVRDVICTVGEMIAESLLQK